MFEIFESVGVPDLLDILFMTIVIYSALVWFKRTRAGFAVLGLFIFGAVYLLARQLDLTLTTIVFQGFFAIILIAIILRGIFRRDRTVTVKRAAMNGAIGVLEERTMKIVAAVKTSFTLASILVRAFSRLANMSANISFIK